MTYHNKNQLIQIICLNIKLPFHRTLALQEFLSLFPPWRHHSCCIQDIRNIFGQQTPSFHWPEVSFPNVCQEVSYNALREYLVEKTNTTNHNLFDIFVNMMETLNTFLQFLLTNFGPKVANFLCLYGTKSTIDFAWIHDRGIRDMMEKWNIFRQDSTSFALWK